MDYGEKRGNDARFDDLRDNLNLGNWAPERNAKSIGERAILSSDVEPQEAPNTDLVQIVELSPEPIAHQVDASRGTEPRDLKSIVGDHFSDKVTAEIYRAENELSQTSNICNFYDEIRDMVEIAGENWAA